jgi:hypothetical protein
MRSVLRGYDFKNLFDRYWLQFTSFRSVKKFRDKEGFKFGASILWTVVVVKELTENCCVQGTGTVREHRE